MKTKNEQKVEDYLRTLDHSTTIREIKEKTGVGHNQAKYVCLVLTSVPDAKITMRKVGNTWLIEPKN